MPGPVDEAQIHDGWEKYKEAATSRGLRPIRVHFNAAKGTAYCETEASTEADVRDAHQEIALPLEDVIEVQTLE